MYEFYSEKSSSTKEMIMNLQKLMEKYQKQLAIAGIIVVLGSWLVIPLAAYYMYNIAALDTAFLLTVFWAGVWSLNVLRKKYL